MLICQTIVFLFVLCKITSASVDTELQLVQILFRHGDRSPVMSYPSDPYKNESNWEQYGGFGQLTQTGMSQHYNFGRFIRERYGSFLSKMYSRKNTNVISTDFDRTLMSAYSLLSGLYEPHDYQVWNEEVKWQPIAVHTTDKASDNVFYGQKCPRFEQLKKEVMETDEYIRINSKYQEMFDVVDRNSGCNEHPKSGCTHMNLNDEWKIFDCLFVEKTHGLKLPDWVGPIYDQLQHSIGWGFYFANRLPEMARLQSGGILKDMRKNINEKVNGKNSKKQLFLYSGHDTYVAALVKLLNLTTYINNPPYASAVALELRKAVDSSDLFVQAYYKNNTANETINYRAMTIDGCPELCPLDTFMELTKELVVNDFQSECKYKDSLTKTMESSYLDPLIDSIRDGNYPSLVSIRDTRSKQFFVNVGVVLAVLVAVTSVLIVVAVVRKRSNDESPVRYRTPDDDATYARLI